MKKYCLCSIFDIHREQTLAIINMNLAFQHYLNN